MPKGLMPTSTHGFSFFTALYISSTRRSQFWRRQSSFDIFGFAAGFAVGVLFAVRRFVAMLLGCGMLRIFAVRGFLFVGRGFVGMLRLLGVLGLFAVGRFLAMAGGFAVGASCGLQRRHRAGVALVVGERNRLAILVVDRIGIEVVVDMDAVDVVALDDVGHDVDEPLRATRARPDRTRGSRRTRGRSRGRRC